MNFILQCHQSTDDTSPLWGWMEITCTPAAYQHNPKNVPCPTKGPNCDKRMQIVLEWSLTRSCFSALKEAKDDARPATGDERDEAQVIMMIRLRSNHGYLCPRCMDGMASGGFCLTWKSIWKTPNCLNVAFQGDGWKEHAQSVSKSE